ncbi:hypothetical protein, partial [Lactococcus petauri]|uniref:hypothetical protein n=1 Tax=Lactococcus petauri TaxID=1940789 RepID=UPI0021F0E280
KIVFSGLVTYGSTDTILGVKNGIVVRTLPSGGGSDLATLIDACPNVDLETLNGSETFPILKDDTVYQLSLGDFADLIG